MSAGYHNWAARNGNGVLVPAFRYELTLDSVPEDRRPYEITGFSRYRFWEADRITLNLAVLPTHGPTFGDYRSFKKLERNEGETNVIIGMG